MFTSKKTRPQKKLSFRFLLITLFLVSIFSFYGAASAANWYVNGDIGTSGNGTTWAEAFTTLQDAIDAASEDDEIWVKKGIYLLSSQINVDKAVGIYGGFAGDETQRNQRNWATNVTTIDGQDSVYHCFDITADATIDGLTITGGNADGSSPDHRGGGIYVYQSSPSINNCTISKNAAEYGGGINNRESSPTITNCTFTENSTIKSGGGIYNYQSTPTITDCTFSGNSATNNGGGIYNYQSTPTITDCTSSGNSANKNGGGMYNNESSPIVTKCSFTNNTAEFGGAIFNNDNTTPTITNCTLRGNSATNNGGGMYNDDNSSPTITNCTFTDNIADFGGGIFNNDNTTPTITNCTLRGNIVTKSGGGMYNDDNAFPTITNCTLSDNSAAWGGGICNDNSSPAITNCTLSGNSATSYGGGIRNKNSSTPTITNSILWNNTAPDGPEIYDDTSNPIINYCDIQGGNYVGQGNINADPLFVDPSNNDFHLQATSPCIDKGSNSAPGIPDTDYEGDSRILDGDNDGTATVDIGADEYEYTSSVKADGDVAPLGNRDGKVDVGDALVALRFALGLVIPTPEDLHHGDVAPLDAQGLPDPDGQIKVGDALVILRMALGLVSLEPTEINGITTLTVEEIAGEGGTVLYQGEEYIDRVEISDDAIVGVIKENQTYLYHPAMGKNVNFSSETNKQAVAYFMLGLDSSGSGASRVTSAYDSVSRASLSDTKIIEDADEVDMATKIHISRDGDKLKFINNAKRWSAVRILDAGYEKIYFLPPKGRILDSNMQRWVLAESDKLFEGMPKVDDVLEFFSSLGSLTITVPSSATIETYGAVFRGLPYHAAGWSWPIGSSEAWQSNHKLVILLNTIDVYYTVLEGFKHLLGLFPLECVDIFTGAFMNMIEAEFLGYMTVEERIETAWYKTLKQDGWNSFANCLAVIPTAFIWELVNTYWDIIAAFDFLFEEIIIPDSAVINGAAYEKAALELQNQEATISVTNTIDKNVQVLINGEYPKDAYLEPGETWKQTYEPGTYTILVKSAGVVDGGKILEYTRQISLSSGENYVYNFEAGQDCNYAKVTISNQTSKGVTLYLNGALWYVSGDQHIDANEVKNAYLSPGETYSLSARRPDWEGLCFEDCKYVCWSGPTFTLDCQGYAWTISGSGSTCP